MEWVIALLLIGVALIFLEIFLPGMVAGTIGLLCLALAVILGYKNWGPARGNLLLFAVICGLVVGAIAWLRFFPNSKAGKVFVSKGKSGDLGAEPKELLNEEGIALTPLRPSGTALLRGKRTDVVTEGGFVEKGTPVRVVQIEGNRVVVRSSDKAEATDARKAW